MTLGPYSDGRIIVPGIYPVSPQGRLYPVAAPNLLDARGAAADALAAFLLTLRFVRWSGGVEPNVEFQLKAVRQEWPEPSEVLLYPSASIVDAGDSIEAAHNFVPTALEETYGKFGEATMLWKIAELEQDFQVDFWADDAPTREAIASKIATAFSPGEDGTRIVLCGSSRYWDLPVRASLYRYKRADNAGSIYPRERRLLATVRCEVDVVELRCSNLVVPTLDVQVGEDVVPRPGPEAEQVSCEGEMPGEGC